MRVCKRSAIFGVWVCLSSSLCGIVIAAAEDGGAPLTNAQLAEKLLRMEKRMRMLESQLEERDARRSAKHRTSTARLARERHDTDDSSPAPVNASIDEALPHRKPILGVLESPVQGLTFGAYGEVIFGRQQNPADYGHWQNGFDARRFVLLPTFAITDNIIFNAEIEFEHAGSGFDNDDKLHGTAEIEQLFVDFKFNPYFNWRAPGIDLIPIGYINQHHEPTQFYSVTRPELYNGLIPSTWKAPATGIYGRLFDGLSYQLQVSHSLEDFGGGFDSRTDGNRVIPFPAGYAPGITGLNALSNSRAPLGDFRQLNNTYAVSGRLDIVPPFIPGLAGSVSAYYSPNVTPRGAYGDFAVADGFGVPLGHTSLLMFDIEARYRIPNTGLELRGEYVGVNIGNPAALRANNDTDPTNNVGHRLEGYSGEIAWHQPLGEFIGSSWEAVPFYRYTRQNFQVGVVPGAFIGTDINLPTGAGQMQYHTAGLALFPSQKVVLKANYQKVINRAIGGAQSDSVLGAVGFFF